LVGGAVLAAPLTRRVAEDNEYEPSRLIRYVSPGVGERAVTNRKTRTVPLPAEEAEYVDALVAAGAYASASEVVRAGLQALQDCEAAIDRWVEDEVIPVYDLMQRDPNRAISGREMAAALDSHHAKRLKRSKRGT
jgi:antitoxin ParD1/3/4